MSSAEITVRARKYREILALIKQLEDEAEAIKATITAEMNSRGVDTLQADIVTIKYTEYQSSRIDTKALKAEAPDLAQRYIVTSTARRFQVA